MALTFFLFVLVSQRFGPSGRFGLKSARVVVLLGLVVVLFFVRLSDTALLKPSRPLARDVASRATRRATSRPPRSRASVSIVPWLSPIALGTHWLR
jgi:hypothetical protein